MSLEQLTAIAREANTYCMKAFELLERDEHPEPGRSLLHGVYYGFGKVADVAVKAMTAALSDSENIGHALSDLSGPPPVADVTPDSRAYAYAIAYDNALAWGRDRFIQARSN